MSRIAVKFNKIHGSYNPGEIATFYPSQAKALIKRGIAAKVRTVSDKGSGSEESQSQAARDKLKQSMSSTEIRPEIDKMKKSELLDYCNMLGLSIQQTLTKAEIIEEIRSEWARLDQGRDEPEEAEEEEGEEEEEEDEDEDEDEETEWDEEDM